MKKIKIISILLLLVSFITLTGCGKKEEPIEEDHTLKASDLSIDDFKWEINASTCQSKECQLLTFNNNSEYDIIEMELNFAKKSTSTENEMNIYSDFLNSHPDYIPENADNNKIVLRAYFNSEIPKESKVSNINVLMGYDVRIWNEYPTIQQLDLMETSELHMGIVGRDNKLYKVIYNFQDKKWEVDSEKIEIDTNIKTSKWQKLSLPQKTHHMILTDEENNLSINFYGISKKSYYEYADKLISEGFIENSYSAIHFTGKNAEGYELDLQFYETESRMSLNIVKK